MTNPQLQQLRQAAEEAVADHVFIDVRKDELLSLLDRLAAVARGEPLRLIP